MPLSLLFPLRVTRPFATTIAVTCAALFAVGPSDAAGFGPCDIETTAPPEVAAAFDKFLVKAIDPSSPLASMMGYAPGAVLSIETPDWRYIKSVGVADPETQAAMDCQSPFQIGSNTKMMTATVLLQLVEEGALGLDDPLSQYLPEIAAALPYGGDMTIRQLAQHRSGVFSYTDNAPDGAPGIMEGAGTNPEALQRSYRPEELLDFVIQHGKANFAPGAEGAWSYSNTGYALLGMIIEALEGKPIAEVYQNRIFAPLGMKDTFLWNDVPRAEFGLPRSYLRAPFTIETTDWNMSQGWAAGGVISTPADMHVFISSLLSGGLFRDASTLAIMQDAVPTGMPTLSRYGIGLGEKEPGLWGHGGQTLGFMSDVAVFQDRKISVVAWGSSSENVMGLGAASVAQSLRQTGIIEDPADAATDDLIAELVGTSWQLVGIEIKGVLTPINVGERYDLRFVDRESIAVGADCNLVKGGWGIAKLVFSVALGPSTLAACPDGSQSDAYLSALGASISVTVLDNTLTIYANRADGLTVLLFKPAE